MNFFDKFFETFRKVDRTINTVDNMQRTAERVEYQTTTVSSRSSRLKWIVLAVIIAVAAIYAFVQ